MIMLFISKDYGRNLPFDKDFEKVFGKKENIVWFIEQKETKLWLAKDWDHLKTEDNWQTFIPKYNQLHLTNKPLEALSFNTEIEAVTFRIKNKFSNFTETEHEFV